MKANFVSTYSLLNGPRLYAKQGQAELAKLNKEMIEARYADVGLALGARTGQSTIIYQEIARMELLQASNSSTSGRLTVTQSALDDLREMANKTMKSLVGLPANADSAKTVYEAANLDLIAMIDKLNSSYAGLRLFAGTATDKDPMKDGSSSVEDAFDDYIENTLSLPPPAADHYATLTKDDIDSFLNDPDFDALFDGVNWGGATGNWSNASSNNLKTQISLTETVETSVNANDPAFQKMAKAYSMLSALPLTDLNTDAFGAVVKKATEAFGDAVNEITNVQARLGSVQTRVTNATDKLAVQINLFKTNINGLEGVDPYETKVKADALETQINMSYSITARLQKLTLLNYI